ncbi:MAG: hypothetical protein JWQ42_1149 [Edaphobacter sp.]|jgi:hypothetical protein|nr:hypothetical protein [Edaphobacter sp.]
MFQYLSRWQNAVAVLTILAIFATSTEGFASQPGEANTFTPENVDGQSLLTQSSYSEARNSAGFLVRVWRGESDNQVWLSLNFGQNFTLGDTETFVAPTVTALGPDNFMIVHTGTDGNMYYTRIQTNANTWDGSWTRVQGGQTTNLSVSVTQFDSQQELLFMAYRGSGNDQRVFGTWFNNNGWISTGPISNGQALSSPSITFNPNSRRLFVAAQGLDGRIWTSSQPLFSTSWAGWTLMGSEQTATAPQIIAQPGGVMMMSYVASDGRPRYRRFDQNLNALTGWTVDTTGFQTFNPVTLTVAGIFIYALLTGFNDQGFFKQVFSPL